VLFCFLGLIFVTVLGVGVNFNVWCVFVEAGCLCWCNESLNNYNKYVNDLYGSFVCLLWQEVCCGCGVGLGGAVVGFGKLP
jgi:hypothetical protein